MKKHQFKETLVVPRAMMPHVNGEAARCGEAVLAQNVREQEQSLQVTGVPATVGAITPGERLLLVAGGHHVTANQMAVKIDGVPVANVEGTIQTAYLIGEVIVVVASSGLTYLSQIEGEWTVLDPEYAVPTLDFSAATTVSRADVAAYTFAAPCSQWQAPLADADTYALARQLRAAWNALNADAVAEGHYAGPVLVRWAVRLHDDTYLWMSDPVRVGDETLSNADHIAATVVSGSSGFTGTEDTAMELTHYSLAVDVSSGISAAWLPLIKSIDVFATDAAQLLTARRSLDYRCITRTVGGHEYILEMGLSRLSHDAITRQLNASPWRLVASAPATSHLSGSDFTVPVEPLTLTSAQCGTIGTLPALDRVVCSAAAGGRLYCCTPSGEVIVSAPGNAMAQAHSRMVAGASPLAMAVVTKPLYSGGFGRYPVYLFTDDGVYAIPQSVTGTLGEARLVDRTVIAADVPPVEGGGDVWFISRHRHLCRLRASKVTVCQRHVPYTAMAWCNAYHELWLLSDQGYPVAMMASGAMSERTVDAASLYSDPLHAMAVSDTGTLLDLEQEIVAEVPVKWHSHPIALSPLMARKVRRIVWHLSSTAADLTLRVTGQWGIMGRDRDLSAMTVTGSIDQPLATAPILVPARTFRLPPRAPFCYPRSSMRNSMKDMKNTIEAVLVENERRKALLVRDRYDPLAGVGCCGDRVESGGCFIPRTVLQANPDFAELDPLEQERKRIEEDFEYWCARCVTIKDKMSGRNVPFNLNRPQRRLLGVMEEQRTAGKPIRVILLKARQWGGSTLVQMYLAWMQLVRHKGWNSLICGHLHATSKSIKRMYNLMLRHYPRELMTEGERLAFTKLEGQPNVQQIEARECLVLTGSSRSEDAVRGYDIAMAHLSEVAFWRASAMHSPDEVVRSVCGSIALKPETVIVLESTANGVGDFFHDEWLRAQMGRSDKIPVFVPWHEIGIYSLAVDNPQALWEQIDDYERTLWEDGCTLEQLNWYHHKRREYRSHELMMAEYPSNASEAFTATGFNPFATEYLDRLEEGCSMEPLLVGDIQGEGMSGKEAKSGIHLVRELGGQLKVWEYPERNTPTMVKYLTVVDVGGRADSSDYSVIAVWRLGDRVRQHAIVAQWRGHIDHDLLAWKAMQLSKYYNNALLAVESNTLTNEAARAGESDFILQKVHAVYGNVYERAPRKLGFHTNVKTKRKAIVALIAALRDNSYVERDIDAVNEMRDYEDRKGRYGARAGKHDDILMTRAIGLLLIQDKQVNPNTPPPDKSLAKDQWLFGKQ